MISQIENIIFRYSLVSFQNEYKKEYKSYCNSVLKATGGILYNWRPLGSKMAVDHYDIYHGYKPVGVIPRNY